MTAPTATKYRFIAKVRATVGKRQVWGVYDTVLGSWPLHRPVIGGVKQDHASEGEAEKEARRVEALS